MAAAESNPKHQEQKELIESRKRQHQKGMIGQQQKALAAEGIIASTKPEHQKGIIRQQQKVPVAEGNN